MVETVEAIRGSVLQVRERIARAADKAGRSATEVTLVAVTKTHPLEAVLAAYRAGVRDFGENRVQEAASKIAAAEGWLADQFGGDGSLAPSAPRWHLIGHLQTNKARLASHLFQMVQSVDSVRVAEALDRAMVHQGGSPLAVLLEVNVAGEATKFGFEPESLIENAARLIALPGLRVEGLMTVAPLVKDPEEVRPVFRRLRQLRDDLRRQHPRLEWRHLSMGMTDDFEVAIEEGATMVRIGRAIFGQRT